VAWLARAQIARTHVAAGGAVQVRRSASSSGYPLLPPVTSSWASVRGPLNTSGSLRETDVERSVSKGTLPTVPDKSAPSEQVVQVGRRKIPLTRLGQRWWPTLGIQKRDVIDYYAAIAPFLLAHLRDRPFTIKRHYNGPRSPFEWIKDAPPEMPRWIATSAQPAKSRGGALVRYPLVQDLASLLWMIEFGCIDLHVWSSRKDLPARPDHVLFDLDPHSVPFANVIEAAQMLHAALNAIGMAAAVKTSGGDGLHVQVPIARRHTYEDVRIFSRIIASAVAAASDGLITSARRPSDRIGVFIDTKMNGHGQQIVSVYSLRPHSELAAVAAPLTWNELKPGLEPGDLTMDAVIDRARRHGDLHSSALENTQMLGPALARAADLCSG
jgi:bifunctional non-homologous end joining protein LigD